MDNQDTNIKRLKEKLASTNEMVLIEEIRKLRQMEAIPGALLLLRDIFENSNNDKLRLTIEHFFNDLNDQSFTDEVITVINAAKNDLTKQKIISSCWQSGLDYSDHIHKFIEYSIDLSYLSTLECYSVIEEWSSSSSSDERDRWIKMLLSSLINQSEEKKVLLNTIISIL
jgi:hypothetical protein